MQSLFGTTILLIKCDFRTENLMVLFGAQVFDLQKQDLIGSPMIKDSSLLSLSEAEENFKMIILRYSVNTLKTHSNKCCKFFYYCRIRDIPIFPVKPVLLNSFLIKMGKEGSSNGEIKSFVNSLTFICRLYGFENVSNEFSVRNTLFSLSKFCKTVKISRKPFSYELIIKLCTKIERIGGYKMLKLAERRTFLMIIVCFYTLMRFDCIRNVRLSNLKFIDDYVHITVPKSKTDQKGEGQSLYLVSTGNSYDPYFILCTYLYDMHEMFGDSDSFLLPSFSYDSKIKAWGITPETPLTYSAAYSAFKCLLKKFHIDSSNLSLHSMRIGGTTEDFRNNLPGHIIDKRGRWKNPGTKFIYNRCSSRDIIRHLRKCNNRKSRL